MKKTTPFILLILVAYHAIGQNTLKLTSGATLKTTGGLVVTLENLNLENDGALAQSAGEGSFRFSGNQTTSISGLSAPVFDNVEIVKTSGANLQLLRSIIVVSGIYFTSGHWDLNNQIVFLQPAALLNNESETSRFIGSSGGFIEITNTLNAPSSHNPGNLGAIITSAQNLGSTIIRRGHKAHIGNFPNGISILRYYDIIPSNNNSLNATFRFKYFDAELNGIDESTAVLWKSYDNINWLNEGFTSRDIGLNYVEKTGIADFSRWTLSSSLYARLIKPVKHQLTVTKTDVHNGKHSWKAWPNPVNKTFWISIKSSGESKATTSLFDNKGALIRTQQDQLLSGNNLLNIDIKELAAGVYYIITEWDNGLAKGSTRLLKL